MSGAGEPPGGVPPTSFPVIPAPVSAEDLTQQFHEVVTKVAILETQVTQIIKSAADYEKRITDGQNDIHTIRRQIAFFRGATWVIGFLVGVSVTISIVLLTAYLKK
jgi:hypothetical protein